MECKRPKGYPSSSVMGGSANEILEMWGGNYFTNNRGGETE